jgi:predicted phosphohydrolase
VLRRKEQAEQYLNDIHESGDGWRETALDIMQHKKVLERENSRLRAYHLKALPRVAAQRVVPLHRSGVQEGDNISW